MAELSGSFFDIVQEPLQAGDSFDVDFDITNSDFFDSAAFFVDFFLSNDNFIDPSTDQFLFRFDVVNGVLAGTTDPFSTNLTLPSANDPFWSGTNTYHVGMVVDAANEVFEFDESNNSNKGEFFDFDSVDITVPTVPPPLAPTIQFSQAAPYQATEGNGTSSVITLFRSGDLTGTSQVQVNIAGGTATSGVDYSGLPVIVSFAAGEGIKTIPLSILPDSLVEGKETLVVSLTNPSGANLGLTTTAALEILDAPPLPKPVTPAPKLVSEIQFSQATPYQATEGDGTNNAITLTRTGDTSDTAQVEVNISGGTATAKVDYNSQLPLTVTFAAGETSKTIPIDLIQDSLVEGKETLTVSIANPTNATINGAATTTLEILDDDSYVGGSGDDIITGDSSANTISGNDGNDTLNGKEGDDVLNGGNGNDVLVGEAGNDALVGGAGNDNLQGGEGNDILAGAAGFDTLSGGNGSDVFRFALTSGVFSKSTIGVATITDFSLDDDRIVLSRRTFNSLKGKSFASVKTLKEAKNSKATLTYIAKTGALFYNQNGRESGFGTGGKFADLSNGLALAKSDIALIS